MERVVTPYPRYRLIRARCVAWPPSSTMSAMPKLFQVNEEDLGELERILPQLSEALTSAMDNRLRVQLRRCQSILSHVRWNYGPHSEVRILPANGESDHAL